MHALACNGIDLNMGICNNIRCGCSLGNSLRDAYANWEFRKDQGCSTKTMGYNMGLFSTLETLLCNMSCKK